jgi:hypothetical protein
MTSAGDWTFTERVQDFLALAGAIENMRLIRSGIDIDVNFHWSMGQALSGSISPIDEENLRSFITEWRQLVMRDEPTHLRTILALAAHHLTIERLRDLSELVGAALGRINSNEGHDSFHLTFSGPKQGHPDGAEYTPWEVADLVMHGLLLHRKDRQKRDVLAGLDPGFQPVIDFIFRQYIIDIVQVMDSTRMILAKAVEKDAVSDVPVAWGPANSLRPEQEHGDTFPDA